MNTLGRVFVAVQRQQFLCVNQGRPWKLRGTGGYSEAVLVSLRGAIIAKTCVCSFRMEDGAVLRCSVPLPTSSRSIAVDVGLYPAARPKHPLCPPCSRSVEVHPQLPPPPPPPPAMHGRPHTTPTATAFVGRGVTAPLADGTAAQMPPPRRGVRPTAMSRMAAVGRRMRREVSPSPSLCRRLVPRYGGPLRRPCAWQREQVGNGTAGSGGMMMPAVTGVAAANAHALQGRGPRGHR